MYWLRDYWRYTTTSAIFLTMAILSVAAVHAAFGPVTDLGVGREPHCALGLNGKLHVVFIDTHVRYLTLDGGTASAVETLPGSSGGRNPFICVGTDGSVHVVWDTWSTAYYTNRVGGAWKTPQALPKAMPERNLYAQVAVASNGAAFTSHWSLTKNEAGYNLFCRVTNTGGSTPTITQVYQERADNRPPSIVGPSPVSTGDGNIHIFIGLPQTKHWIMDSNGGVTGGQNISRTPHDKTGEGLQGYFVGTDPGVTASWWDGVSVTGAVVNTLSRADSGKQALVAGTGSGEFPYPRAAFDPVRNKVYVLYPKSSKPALSSWIPQQDSIEQLGNVSESNISTDPRGPGAGGIAARAGGGVHIVYSTGGRVYYRTADAANDDQPPSIPTGVQAAALSPTSAMITWVASTDNIGVAGYRIFRNGSEAGTSGTTSYTDAGLEPITTYSYTVSAYDAAGNESEQSSPPAVATTFQVGAGSQWLWLADNHTVVGDKSYESLWADGTNKMATAVKAGNWDAQWNTFAPGVATILNPDGSSGRYLMRTGFVGVDDPGAPNSYWDASHGVTIAAKVYIPSADNAASGNGNVLLAIKNASTENLSGGSNGFRLWWGWDYSEYGICASAWNAGGTRLRGWIVPTVSIADVWSVWTISAKRHGNTILWDLWINGVQHGADMLGPDGNYHTYVGFDPESPTESYIYIGQRRVQSFTHKSHWDYVGVTNAGVVPGWDGISQMADIEAPSTPTNVQAVPQTPKQIKLTWNASTDNVGVTGYKIFRNGDMAATSSTTNYIDSALVPSTTYSYRISAYDAAGNKSPQSSQTVATTMAAVDIATAKGLANGTTVGMVSQIVTAVFDGCIYVGAADRHIGIRVVTTDMPVGIGVGSVVDIGGSMNTIDGERCIDCATLVAGD